jgi:hypothetical protein
MIITPGGMSAKGLDAWSRGIKTAGFTQTHRINTRYGDVYLAEKKVPEGTKVWWAARNMIQEAEYPPGTSPVARKNETLALAMITLKLREATMKELS